MYIDPLIKNPLCIPQKCSRRIRVASPILNCEKSLEVAMILSKLHSGEKFNLESEEIGSEVKAKRMQGGTGDFDEDWFEPKPSQEKGFEMFYQRMAAAETGFKIEPASTLQCVWSRQCGESGGIVEKRMKATTKSRTGKWSTEEEEYTRALVYHFRSGSLKISPGKINCMF